MKRVEPRRLYLDAYLELPEEILEHACALNRRITASAGGSIDFGTGRIPHITLYMGLFPEDELPAITGELACIASRTCPFPVCMLGGGAGMDGYLFWNVVADEPLRRLHEKVVTALNPLRHGSIREKYLDDLKKFTTEECNNINDYGFPWVLEQFRPHVTIGRVGEARAAEAAALLEYPELSGRAVRLALGSVGEHGVVLESAAAHPLSGLG